ncbi:hypothetical protein AVEN_5442-1 [Araneus ventricosus]|uniref:Uncharacterized protein n=1 Tax=Araneus ventricosus TaxID=182803 RepID=A0A4Y2DW93_ARAVE|nr:hypothetical protein AVEN_5442-1 [Araneus ventricosus]
MRLFHMVSEHNPDKRNHDCSKFRHDKNCKPCHTRLTESEFLERSSPFLCDPYLHGGQQQAFGREKKIMTVVYDRDIQPVICQEPL